MRCDEAIYGNLFSCIDLEKRIRADHPLRVIPAQNAKISFDSRMRPASRFSRTPAGEKF